MKADQERAAIVLAGLQRPDRAVGEQLGEIAILLDPRRAVPEILGAGEAMGEIVDAAAAQSPEFLVAAFVRAVFRQQAEMPFADQRGRVTAVAKQRGERRMRRRQADIAAAQRLLQADRQAVLVTPRHQRDPARRADRAVGISVAEFDAVGRQPIERRRREIAAAVAGEIGVAEIVGHDEKEARRVRARRGGEAGRCRERGRAERARHHGSASHSGICSRRDRHSGLPFGAGDHLVSLKPRV